MELDASGNRDISSAYEAYRQAMLRNGRIPTLWNSVAILYYRVGQLRDSFDALSRAIRLNPYVWTVWYNLGILVCLPYHSKTDSDSRTDRFIV